MPCISFVKFQASFTITITSFAFWDNFDLKLDDLKDTQSNKRYLTVRCHHGLAEYIRIVSSGNVENLAVLYILAMSTAVNGKIDQAIC